MSLSDEVRLEKHQMNHNSNNSKNTMLHSTAVFLRHSCLPISALLVFLLSLFVAWAPFFHYSGTWNLVRENLFQHCLPVEPYVRSTDSSQANAQPSPAQPGDGSSYLTYIKPLLTRLGFLRPKIDLSDKSKKKTKKDSTGTATGQDSEPEAKNKVDKLPPLSNSEFISTLHPDIEKLEVNSHFALRSWHAGPRRYDDDFYDLQTMRRLRESGGYDTDSSTDTAADDNKHQKADISQTSASDPRYPDEPLMLFVPGNLGNWKQGFNYGQHYGQAFGAKNYGLDFHVQPTAFDPGIIKSQAEFLNASVKSLLKPYNAKEWGGDGSSLKSSGSSSAEAKQKTKKVLKPEKKKVFLVVHSMGLFVVKHALFRFPKLKSKIQAVFCQSCVQNYHPLIFIQRSMVKFLATECVDDVDVATGGKVRVFGVNSGSRDELLSSEYAYHPQVVNTAAVKNVYSDFTHASVLFSLPIVDRVTRYSWPKLFGDLDFGRKRVVTTTKGKGDGNTNGGDAKSQKEREALEREAQAFQEAVDILRSPFDRMSSLFNEVSQVEGDTRKLLSMVDMRVINGDMREDVNNSTKANSVNVKFFGGGVSSNTNTNILDLSSLYRSSEVEKPAETVYRWDNVNTDGNSGGGTGGDNVETDSFVLVVTEKPRLDARPGISRRPIQGGESPENFFAHDKIDCQNLVNLFSRHLVLKEEGEKSQKGKGGKSNKGSDIKSEFFEERWSQILPAGSISYPLKMCVFIARKEVVAYQNDRAIGGRKNERKDESPKEKRQREKVEKEADELSQKMRRSVVIQKVPPKSKTSESETKKANTDSKNDALSGVASFESYNRASIRHVSWWEWLWSAVLQTPIEIDVSDKVITWLGLSRSEIDFGLFPWDFERDVEGSGSKNSDNGALGMAWNANGALVSIGEIKSRKSNIPLLLSPRKHLPLDSESNYNVFSPRFAYPVEYETRNLNARASSSGDSTKKKRKKNDDSDSDSSESSEGDSDVGGGNFSEEELKEINESLEARTAEIERKANGGDGDIDGAGIDLDTTNLNASNNFGLQAPPKFDPHILFDTGQRKKKNGEASSGEPSGTLEQGAFIALFNLSGLEEESDGTNSSGKSARNPVRKIQKIKMQANVFSFLKQLVRIHLSLILAAVLAACLMVESKFRLLEDEGGSGTSSSEKSNDDSAGEGSTVDEGGKTGSAATLHSSGAPFHPHALFRGSHMFRFSRHVFFEFTLLAFLLYMMSADASSSATRGFSAPKIGSLWKSPWEEKLLRIDEESLKNDANPTSAFSILKTPAIDVLRAFSMLEKEYSPLFLGSLFFCCFFVAQGLLWLLESISRVRTAIRKCLGWVCGICRKKKLSTQLGTSEERVASEQEGTHHLDDKVNRNPTVLSSLFTFLLPEFLFHHLPILLLHPPAYAIVLLFRSDFHYLYFFLLLVKLPQVIMTVWALRSQPESSIPRVQPFLDETLWRSVHFTSPLQTSPFQQDGRSGGSGHYGHWLLSEEVMWMLPAMGFYFLAKLNRLIVSSRNQNTDQRKTNAAHANNQLSLCNLGVYLAAILLPGFVRHLTYRLEVGLCFVFTLRIAFIFWGICVGFVRGG